MAVAARKSSLRRLCCRFRLLAVSCIGLALTLRLFGAWEVEFLGRTDPSEVSHEAALPGFPVGNSPEVANRTLVVVVGSLRGGELAWQSLYHNVLDVNHADLAVLTDDVVPDAYNHSSIFDRAKYVWTVHNYDDWADAMDLVYNSSAWREPLLSLYYAQSNIMLGGLRIPPTGKKVGGSGAIVFMFRWFLANHIRELRLQERYDRFIVTRSDHFYTCKHDVAPLDPRYLWVPWGEDYRGICDRHFVSSSRDILTALNIMPPLLANPHNYYKQLTKPRYNSERFLLHRWAEDGLMPLIRRFDRVMFVCATAEDSSRWGMRSTFPVEEGVHIKYIEEYNASRLACGLATV